MDRITDKQDEERIRHITHFTHLFQMEQLARLGDWEAVLPAIKVRFGVLKDVAVYFPSGPGCFRF